MAKSAKHPGFSSVAKSIEKKEGVSAKSAGDILAASTRRAKSNPAAVKKNPNLKRVKGK